MPRSTPRNRNVKVTREDMLRTFDVDPSCPSGLRWKYNKYKKFIGRPAGSVFRPKNKNYGPLWIVTIKDKNHYAHRVIWTMVNGEIPKGLVIDHLNGIPSDNRIENLSLKTGGHNNRARHKKHCRNTSGFDGVSWRKDMRKWTAQVTRDGKYYRLGYFKDIEEAARAVDQAKRKWAERHNEEVRLFNFPN